jgi:hypothetical protein
MSKICDNGVIREMTAEEQAQYDADCKAENVAAELDKACK